MIGLPDTTDRSNTIEKDAVKEAVKVNHVMELKEKMIGKKLERMKITDLRERRS